MSAIIVPPSFHCELCPKFFSKPVYLKKHMIIHNGSKRFQCEFCSKTCLRNGDLKKHMVQHTGEKRCWCEVCGKAFSQRGHLKEHMLVHSDDKPVRCSICSKCFKDDRSLRRHILVHTGERPFKCLDCCKIFSQSGSLRTHMLVVHCGEKAYGCGECSKSYAFIQSLKEHMKIHTGEKLSIRGTASQGFKGRKSAEMKLYRCDECFKCFLEDTVLKNHMLVHSNTEDSDDVECKIEVKSECSEDGDALLSYDPDRLFECGTCSECFLEDSLLKRHMLVHDHPEEHLNDVEANIEVKEYYQDQGTPTNLKVGDENVTFKCGTCSECFTENRDLKRHMLDHVLEKHFNHIETSKHNIHLDHTKKSDIPYLPIHNEEKPFQCGCCFQSFSEKSVLKRHILDHVLEKRFDHVAASNRNAHSQCSEDEVKLIPYLQEKDPEKSFQCGSCFESFSENNLLKRHMLDHALEKSFDHVADSNCNVHSQCSEDEDKLIPYLQENDAEKPFQCESCFESFSQKSLLKRHMLDHVLKSFHSENSDIPIPYLYMQMDKEGKPFQCSSCFESFSENNLLKRHMLDHALEKSLENPQCDVELKADAESEERLFQCSHCSKMFPSSHSLSRHMPVHTGVKQFQCDQCDKTFTLGGYLRAHKLVVHGNTKPYVCGECSKSFAFNATLKTHMLVHSGHQPFQCENCSKSFSLKGNLKRHVMLHCNVSC